MTFVRLLSLSCFPGVEHCQLLSDVAKVVLRNRPSPLAQALVLAGALNKDINCHENIIADMALGVLGASIPGLKVVPSSCSALSKGVWLQVSARQPCRGAPMFERNSKTNCSCSASSCS